MAAHKSRKSSNARFPKGQRLNGSERRAAKREAVDRQHMLEVAERICNMIAADPANPVLKQTLDNLEDQIRRLYFHHNASRDELKKLVDVYCDFRPIQGWHMVMNFYGKSAKVFGELGEPKWRDPGRVPLEYRVGSGEVEEEE